MIQAEQFVRVPTVWLAIRLLNVVSLRYKSIAFRILSHVIIVGIHKEHLVYGIIHSLECPLFTCNDGQRCGIRCDGTTDCYDR